MRHNRNSDPQCVAPVFLREELFSLAELEHNNRHTDADLHPDDTQDTHHGRTAVDADQHQARDRVHQRLQNRHTDQNPVPILKPLPPRPVRKRRTQQRFQKHQQNHGFRQI